MKKILLILIASITLCACNNGGAQSNSATKNSTEQVDSDTIVPKKFAELQHEYRDLKNSIRADSARIESVEQSLKDSNSELDNKVDKRLVYVLVGICILLLLLVVISLCGIHSLQKSKSKIKSTIASLENAINRLKDEGAVSNNRASVCAVHDYRDDIDYLQRQIDALKKKGDLQNVSKKEPTRESESDYKKTPLPAKDIKSGYFGVNDNRGRIGKVYMSATEEAVFQYFVKADGLVEFEPFSVKRIKSISSIRCAVNITEGSLQDATDMKVIKRGQAVQREQNGQKYWEVLYPAEVKLK